MPSLLLIGPGCSLCCTVVSFFGVFFLFIIGALFSAHVEELTQGKHPPHDPDGLASACFVGGALYLFLFVFCGCQFKLNQKRAAANNHFSTIG